MLSCVEKSLWLESDTKSMHRKTENAETERQNTRENWHTLRHGKKNGKNAAHTQAPYSYSTNL